MRVPHMMTLAQIDGQRFITACRSGVVHVTWGRVTLRFLEDEFRRWAGLLARALDPLPPAFLRDGELSIRNRPDGEGELRVGPLVLSLPLQQLQELAQAARQAVASLDEIRASGMWEQQEAEEAPPGFLELFRRIPFSRN